MTERESKNSANNVPEPSIIFGFLRAINEMTEQNVQKKKQTNYTLALIAATRRQLHKHKHLYGTVRCIPLLLSHLLT